MIRKQNCLPPIISWSKVHYQFFQCYDEPIKSMKSLLHFLWCLCISYTPFHLGSVLLLFDGSTDVRHLIIPFHFLLSRSLSPSKLMVDIDVNEFFVLSSVPHTRGHVYKLYKAYSSGIRSSFFCERVINVWNSLPADVDFSSVNTFKRGIECVDFTQFLRRCLWFVCMFFFLFGKL